APALRRGGPQEETDQKSICALIFTNRGCSTDVGVSQLPVGFAVVGRTKFWLYVSTGARLNRLYTSRPTLVRVRPMRTILAKRISSSLTRSPYSVPGAIRLTVA